jgi:hypothetical protein
MPAFITFTVIINKTSPKAVLELRKWISVCHTRSTWLEADSWGQWEERRCAGRSCRTNHHAIPDECMGPKGPMLSLELLLLFIFPPLVLFSFHIPYTRKEKKKTSNINSQSHFLKTTFHIYTLFWSLHMHFGIKITKYQFIFPCNIFHNPFPSVILFIISICIFFTESFTGLD